MQPCPMRPSVRCRQPENALRLEASKERQLPESTAAEQGCCSSRHAQLPDGAVQAAEPLAAAHLVQDATNVCPEQAAGLHEAPVQLLHPGTALRRCSSGRQQPSPACAAHHGAPPAAQA